MEGTGGHIGPIGDMEFEVTTKDAIANYAQWWRRQHYFMFNDPARDCDNYAAAFHGDLCKWPGWAATPKVLVWSTYLGGHAYNLHVALESLENPKLRVYFIEPQSGYLEELAPEHFEGLVVVVN